MALTGPRQGTFKIPFTNKYLPDFNFGETVSGGKVGTYSKTEPLAAYQPPTRNQSYDTGYSSGGGGGSVQGASTSIFDNSVSKVQGFTNDRENDIEQENKIDKEGINRYYNDVNSAYEEQIPFFESSRQRGLSTLTGALEGARGEVSRLSDQARGTFENSVAEASDTAKSVQRKNRNVLRALGILGSSAAGELLSAPYNEFDKQRAGLREQLNYRTQELDNFLIEKTNEHANMVKDLEDRYAQLVGQIKSDIRFNEGERARALKGADAAARNRIAEIRNSLLNYEMQVEGERRNIASAVQQMGDFDYNTLAPNLKGITASTPQITAEQNRRQIAVQDPEKEKETALLSALAGRVV